MTRKSNPKPTTVFELDRWETTGLFQFGGKGSGLYFKVSPRRHPDGDRFAKWGKSGELVPEVTKSWIFRYRDRITKKLRDMGLGSYPEVGVREAKEAASQMRKVLRDGLDPFAVRMKRREAILEERRKEYSTFQIMAQRYWATKKLDWGERHGNDWINSLDIHVNPIIGNRPIYALDSSDVLRVLRPIWEAKPETAGRIRRRIEEVWNFAKAERIVGGENPAKWEGNLKSLLPSLAKVRKEEHHPALPFSEVASFVAELRKQKGHAALALEFAILTVARTSEVTGALWDEIDYDKATWTVPAERMKAGKKHVVPLSPRAVEILKSLGDRVEGQLIFKGGSEGKQASNGYMLSLLRRMGRSDITVHGFRSTFRDWAGEVGEYDGRAIEFALAHKIPDKVEAAYARATMVDKRRPMMEDWANYCGKEGSPRA